MSAFVLALVVSLEQRLLVLNRGLHETRPEVRAAENLLVGKWWRVDCAGDALLMVGLLDVAHSHSKFYCGQLGSIAGVDPSLYDVCYNPSQGSPV